PSYRDKDKSFVPTVTVGTSLEGYVWKDGSGQSSGYNVVNLYPADMSFFWAYSLAYSKTGDGFMWQMLKDIAAGNGLGEIGQILTPHPELQLDTACDHPYGVFGFLELYRSTKQPDYLKMACRIADNIVENRLHKGFFVPTKKHLYTRFDCFEPLALLRLEAAMRYKSDAVPQPWPSIPLFVNKYRYKIQGIDRHVIYGFTESSEPPISIEEAAAIGDVDRIRQLIEQGANVGDFDSLSYMTPLHRAAKEGQKPVVELLLANGAPVNERDLELKTPLHYAVENRYEGIVELLLAHGAGINNKDRRGRTPMDIISRNDNPIKKLLLVKAAETSIHAAAILGDQAQVKVFLDQGIDVDVNDDKGNTSLFYAVRESHDELSRFLIDQGADINYTDKNGYIPLSWALWNEDREMMKLLVTNCADVNFVAKDDWPFLHYLAENNDRELVELFLSHGAKLNVKDNESLTELHIAVSEGNRDLARFLVSKGATALELHLAVCLGDLARVKSLVEEGVDVDTKDESGWTPLYWAASTAEEEVAEFLIGKGAGIDVRANNNCTPLHQAAFVGAAQLASLLISKGADSNARDEGNGTPLHSAAEGGHKDVVELLLANGADVNAKGKDGRGPLHRAVQAGHREVVQLLLANGADVSAKNNKGFTPLDMATMMSRLPKFKAVQEEIVKILTKAAEEQKAEEKERTEKKPSSESPDMSAGVMQQAIIPPFFSLPFTNPIGNDELANVLWLRRLQGLPSVAGGTYSLRVSMTGALGCQRNLGRITYFGILILIDRSDHGYTNQTRIHKNDGGSRGFCGGLFAAA
ncbi:MAG: ankyrin repeat domain-containing protein, partial [Planctomycetes bacterium]|nr:ankyrin repeat domain-containing protein [Planctomycetota bacterium]